MREIDIKEISVTFRPYPFIVAAYQFGSTIRGGEGPLSDLDIAVLVRDEQTPLAVDLLRVELLLAYELQKQLHVQRVDLITLNRQRLPLQYAILRTGRLIFETDPKYRIRFVQKVIQDYLDFQPTLELIGQFHTKGWLRRCGI
ncbi:MAG: nucleotidyltransferase domain-containing protein [Desulfobacterales bacterium]|nr:nucleotidyltransferase domain-containing protein [Desulfobacterales bacterium]